MIVGRLKCSATGILKTVSSAGVLDNADQLMWNFGEYIKQPFLALGKDVQDVKVQDEQGNAKRYAQQNMAAAHSSTYSEAQELTSGFTS